MLCLCLAMWAATPDRDRTAEDARRPLMGLIIIAGNRGLQVRKLLRARRKTRGVRGQTYAREGAASEELRDKYTNDCGPPSRSQLELRRDRAGIGAGAFTPRAGGRWLAAIHWALRMSIMTIAQVSMLERLAGALAPGRGIADSSRATK